MTLNLNLTKSAAKQIKQLGDFEKAPYFRVSVDGGGCSVFNINLILIPKNETMILK